MAHGGKREGSGRRSGALTKRTREVAERALADGKAPLEVMLDNMRHFQQVALDAEAVIEGLNEDEIAAMGENHEQQFKALLAKVKQAAGLRQMAHECARDAAAYMHPKLAAIEHTVNDKQKPDELSSEELDARIAAVIGRLEGLAGGTAGPAKGQKQPPDVRKFN